MTCALIEPFTSLQNDTERATGLKVHFVLKTARPHEQTKANFYTTSFI
jgi:hypothetical protein